MEAGIRIGPNIRLERVLSEGGMGSVWVAEHLTLGTQVAVKFITRDLADNAQMLMRFQREATAAAQIKSPHVVQVFDHGVTEDGHPYIVMELLHGEDLDERIERLGRLSPGETALIVRHTCKALGVAHRLGIVHRDIKPANLFVVDADGEPFVKVLDFGIAKRRSEAGTVSGVTSTGAMVGTPHFMSPEQVTSSRDAGASSDLWAVAVVAYSCLLGRRPFEGETVGALCIAIHAARFLPPSVVDPTLPAELDAWFVRALAREPEARFRTAKELADTFVAALPSSARSIRPPSSTAETVAETAKRPSRAPTVAEPVAARSAPQTLGGASVKTDSGRTRSRTLIGAAVGVVALGGVTLWLATPRRITADVSPALSTPAPTFVPAIASASGTASTTATPSATSLPGAAAPAGTGTSATTTPTPTTTSTTLGASPPLHAAPRASHPAATPPTTPTASSLPPAPKDRGF